MPVPGDLDLHMYLYLQGVALGTAKAMAGKLTAPFVSKVRWRRSRGSSSVLLQVMVAGGGAAAGSVAGPLGARCY